MLRDIKKALCIISKKAFLSVSSAPSVVKRIHQTTDGADDTDIQGIDELRKPWHRKTQRRGQKARARFDTEHEEITGKLPVPR
jgi:hypothetical protein